MMATQRYSRSIKVTSTMKIICALLVSCLLLIVSAEQYTFDFTKRNVLGESSSSRALQADNEEPCTLDGNNVVCVYSFAAGSVGNETSILFMARCDIDPLYGFDYRRLSNCACLAQVTPINGVMKECPCSVCGVDLGETPVSVDCSMHEIEPIVANGTETTATNRAANITEENSGSVTLDDSVTIPTNETDKSSSNANVTNSNKTMVDPYIFSTCTSIDCFGACNGTCSLNCNDPSGNVCDYCESYSGPGTPTASPTGSGKNDIEDLGKETSGASYPFKMIASISALVTAGYFIAV